MVTVTAKISNYQLLLLPLHTSITELSGLRNARLGGPLTFSFDTYPASLRPRTPPRPRTTSLFAPLLTLLSVVISNQVYALTTIGTWVAAKLEKAAIIGGGVLRPPPSPSAAGSPSVTISPILNRASYASFSEGDGGGGGGAAVSSHSGLSPLAPTRSNGAARPRVRLLIDSREKGGASRRSKVQD